MGDRAGRDGIEGSVEGDADAIAIGSNIHLAIYKDAYTWRQSVVREFDRQRGYLMALLIGLAIVFILFAILTLAMIRQFDRDNDRTDYDSRRIDRLEQLEFRRGLPLPLPPGGTVP